MSRASSNNWWNVWEGRWVCDCFGAACVVVWHSEATDICVSCCLHTAARLLSYTHIKSIWLLLTEPEVAAPLQKQGPGSASSVLHHATPTFCQLMPKPGLTTFLASLNCKHPSIVPSVHTNTRTHTHTQALRTDWHFHSAHTSRKS